MKSCSETREVIKCAPLIIGDGGGEACDGGLDFREVGTFDVRDGDVDCRVTAWARRERGHWR